MNKSKLRTNMFIRFDDNSVATVIMKSAQFADFIVFDTDEGMSYKIESLPLEIKDWKLNNKNSVKSVIPIQILMPRYKKYYGRPISLIFANNMEVLWERKKKHDIWITIDGKGVRREMFDDDETYNTLKEILEELELFEN